ncbi:hypothetical protein BH18ACT13_BH18ACT13_07780 [soil metagenome]
MSGYELRRLEPELLEQAAELVSSVRGGTLEQHIAHYDWKYLHNPYIAEPIMHVALRGGRAVGMRGFYGTCWENGAGGQRYVFPAASDSTILAEHRDGKLYRALGEAMLEDAASRGFTHLLNLSASPQTALTAMLQFGWKGIGPREVMATRATTKGPRARGLRRLVPAPARALIRRGRGRLISDPGRRAFAALDRSELGRGSRSPTEIRLTSSPAELADIARRSGGNARLRPARDDDFYRWKFSNPTRTYRFVVADDGAGRCGYLILCWKFLPCVFMLDWQATSTDLSDELLATALSKGKLSAVSIWSAGLSPAELAILRARGFAPLERTGIERRRQSLLVRPLANPEAVESWVLDGIRLDVASSWDVRATASDFF